MIEFLSEHWVVLFGLVMYSIGYFCGWCERKYKSCDEWCHDCKEYDKKNHCCPRFNKVIRKTVEEMKNKEDNP